MPGDTQKISKVVRGLQANRDKFCQMKHPCACQKPAPSSAALDEIFEGLWDLIFPLRYRQEDLHPEQDDKFIEKLIKKHLPALQEQIHRGICFFCTQKKKKDCTACAAQAEDMTARFMERLPAVQALLATDVLAHYEGDPASTCTEETILCYPGVLAITGYRLAHELQKLKIPLVPRMLSELLHSKTGIDIHPGAQIGESFFIDHGTGVVIGETCVIGDRVKIYQGVTLGAKSFPKDEQGRPIKGVPRHPIVEDDVVIYSEATILGRITLGRGSMIGGNVWLTESVPPKSRILVHSK